MISDTFVRIVIPPLSEAEGEESASSCGIGAAGEEPIHPSGRNDKVELRMQAKNQSEKLNRHA